MNDKMTAMKRELTKEREADENLVKRMKLEKPPTCTISF